MQNLALTSDEEVLGLLLPRVKFQNYRCRNVDLLPPKSSKLVIFVINLSLGGNHGVH